MCLPRRSLTGCALRLVLSQGSQRGELSENDKAIRAWLAKRDAALKR